MASKAAASAPKTDLRSRARLKALDTDVSSRCENRRLRLGGPASVPEHQAH